MNIYYFYILCSKRNGTLYTGITSDLKKRIFEHRNKLSEGFTKDYDVDKLVWYEVHEDVRAAIAREKLIKRWKRKWKPEMVDKFNPLWEDLYETI